MATDPTTAQEQFACDRDNAFLDTTIFAETVLYNSTVNSITNRSIKLVQEDRDGGQVRNYTAWIANHASLGVLAPVRGDTITLASGDVVVVIEFETQGVMHELELARTEDVV